MPTLNLIKITDKQLPLLATLLVHFHHEYERATRLQNFYDRPGFIYNIPLHRLYSTIKVTVSQRPVVLFAASVFFKRVTTGSALSGKCSGWAPLETPHINNQMQKLLPKLHEDNADHFESLKSSLTTKIDPVTNQAIHYVTLTSVFRFKDEDDAKALRKSALEIQIYTEERAKEPLSLDTQNKNGFTLRHSLNTILKKWRSKEWPVDVKRAMKMIARDLEKHADDILDFIKTHEFYGDEFEPFLCEHQV